MQLNSMLEQINNQNVKVTKFTLKPDESTGFHTHELDYVIVPITNGELKIIDKQDKEVFKKLIAGEPYFRKKGVEHNVINNGSDIIIFVEVEIKKK